jgi:hypothetical protein
MKSLPAGVLLTTAIILVGLTEFFPTLAQTSAEDYRYFPHPGAENAHLALTAQGDGVKMTYTPATYRILKTNPGKEIELQIQDALLESGTNSYDVNRDGMEAKMALTFSSSANDWEVRCNNQLVAYAGQPTILVDIDHCGFKGQKVWSHILSIDTGSTAELLMKTIWSDDQGAGTSNYHDLINVFSFRAKHGEVGLASTNTTNISFRTEEQPELYSDQLNWAVLYNTDTKARFEFIIDVSDKDEVILFDKDADASKLHGETTPPDSGITMNVTWADGSPISKYPDWTKFDQRRAEDFLDPLPRALTGETNSFTGPSGDTGNVSPESRSVQWYRIPVSNHKNSQIKVTWSGFTANSNAFGFASSAALRPPCLSDCGTIEIQPGISLVLTANPLPGKTVVDGQEITYTMWLKNETDHALTNVKFFMDSPQLTIKTSGDNISELGNIPPHTTTEEATRRIITTKVNSTATTATISSEGYFAFTADQFTEKIFALPIYHYLRRDEPNEDQPDQPDPPCSNLDCPPPDICTNANGCKNPQTPPKPPARPGDKGCAQVKNKKFSACISADPLPNTYGMKPGDTITYKISVINHSNIQNLEGLVVKFQAPDLTVQTQNLASLAIPVIPPNTALPIPINIAVTIQNINESNFTISTKNRITLIYPNLEPLILPEILHHVGQGDISIERCINLQDEPGCEVLFPGKELQIKPGRIINVVDIITNNRSSIYRQPYQPIPFSQDEFEYLANSIFRVRNWLTIDEILTDFSDPISDPEPGKFPPKNGIDVGSISANQQRAIHFQYAPLNPEENEESCFTVDLPATGDSSVICVIQESEEPLEISLEASPPGKPDGEKIAAGEVISYTVRIGNYSRNTTIENISLQAPRPPGTCCLGSDGNCSSKGDFCPVVSGISDLGRGESLSVSYLVKIKIDNDPPLKEVFNDGVVVNYGDQQSQKTNSISHEIDDQTKPNGTFYHDITLSRHTVLNSANSQARVDQADVSVVQHEFGFSGTNNSSAPLLQENNRPQAFVQYWCSNALSKNYDAPWGSSLLVYNSQKRTPVSTQYQISSDDLHFEISTDIPDATERPGFVMIRKTTADQHFTDHTHSFTFKVSGSDQVNHFMRDGQIFTYDQITTTDFRAVKDGIGGKVEAKNHVKTATQPDTVPEDIWRYVPTGQQQLLGICAYNTTFAYRVYAPIYHWQIDPQAPIPLIASDKDTISVYTSTAWLETHLGNFGIDTIIRYSNPLQNPNFVPLADRNILTAPKDYAPPGSYNAEQLIFLQDNSGDNLSSKIKNGKKYLSDPLQLGFIPSAEHQGSFQLARGDAYDRLEQRRNFEKDLLTHQLYGKVITVKGNTTYIGSQTFAADTITHIIGNLIIDDPSIFTILGGKARLYVDGDVFIKSNIKYGNNSGTLETIPSLRVHSKGNLFIDGNVTQVELMMLSEGEFHSGKSKKQLVILGDVIAGKVFLERQPLIYDAKVPEDEQAVNRPAEIIYEDYRKYILPPPGDQQLPDTGNIWREVNVDNGEEVDWEKFTEEVKS